MHSLEQTEEGSESRRTHSLPLPSSPFPFPLPPFSRNFDPRGVVNRLHTTGKTARLIRLWPPLAAMPLLR